MITTNLTIFALALAVLRCVPARAEDTTCTSVHEIDEHIQSCEDNKIFLERAQKCYEGFKGLRTQKAAEMNKRFERSGNDAQRNDFHAKQRDSDEAVRTHDQMIALGEKMMKEMDGYFDYFEHPEDVDADEEDGDAVDSQVWAESCYRENALGLDKLMDELENDINTMKQARAEEAKHSRLSATVQTNLDNSSLNSAPVGGSSHGEGSGKRVPSGASQNGASDITGVKQDQEKQKR
jgi:regulator of RNase E activity RraB